MIRDLVVRILATALVCLVAALASSGYAAAVGNGLQDAVASSSGQSSSGQPELSTSLVADDTNTPSELEEPAAEPQESNLSALRAAGGDAEVLRRYLRDADPTILAAAFEALASQDKTAAVEALLTNVRDTSQSTRLQALGYLVENARADEQTVTAVLGEALQDPDPAFTAYAIQILAARGDADAIEALRQALHGADPSTSVQILESVVNTDAGLPLLHEALSDSDETIRSAAETLLKQRH